VIAMPRFATVGLRVVIAVAALVASGAGPAQDDFVLAERLHIGAYVVETYGAQEDGWAREELVRVIPPHGEPFEARDARVWLVEQQPDERWHRDAITYAPGDDITGDGVPDLLIEGYSMGAHCCFSYWLLSLGATLEVVWEGFTADASVTLVDLLGDGRVQLLTHDMSYAYAFCSFADSPAPLVVLDVVDGEVRVANTAYPDAYAPTIAWGLEWALHDLIDHDPDDQQFDPYHCRVAHLVLALLYSGREEAAAQAIVTFYRGSDPEAFREALWAIAHESPWYRP
jgi:hypothetical protein